jgi:alkanesulfonate monooxygenase SsuD/methylene tetrahydromethanopterin reductase-like flavin-dependent oxidoreductase (luciferase family)
MTTVRAEMRNRIFRDTGMRIEVPPSDLPGTRTGRGDGVIYGSPARVAEDIAALDRLGLGGIIAVFRMGPMPHALATQNLELFMRQVAPQFRS